MTEYRNKEWLKHQFIELNKSTSIIAKELGVCRNTISTWKKKFNLKKPRYYRNLGLFEEFKLSLGCKICGYKKNAHVLQFHHERGNYQINPSSYRHEKTKKELEKGNVILLCTNCHMELHYEKGERKLD